MLHKNHRQFLRQLQQKKFRSEKQCFVVEGKKSIQEFLRSDFELEILFYTTIFWDNVLVFDEKKAIAITLTELESLSFLKNPDEGIAVFRMPKPKPFPQEGLIVALDAVRDPGNLGTIIRLCDWFGVKHIVCSSDAVDCYNSKVVQATMGSLTRVCVHYTDLPKMLQNTHLPIFGAVLEGENVYQKTLPKEGILVLGNEANGISEAVLQYCTQKITIPQQGDTHTESLNVAMASAILLSEFCRNSF